MTENKPNLEAFGSRPDLIFIIDRFNYIEGCLNSIICNYISPQNDKSNFVQSILLNTAIVSFGSKLKLFFHINAVEEWVDIKKDNLHRLLHIRNQFAHTGKDVITVNLDTETGECESESCLMLESVSGTGKLVEVDSETALHEFTQLYVEIREKLHLALDQSKMANKANSHGKI